MHWPETVSNQVLRDKAGEEPVEVQIRRRKWRWIGHILRRTLTQLKQVLSSGTRRDRTSSRQTVHDRAIFNIFVALGY